MRFIEGPTLAQAIQEFHEADRQPNRDPGERALALRKLLGHFVAVCNTVAYAHSRGVLHRDLKPANVLLGKYGETLVVDWGLAKRFDRTEAERSGGEPSLGLAGRTSPEGGTRSGEVKGTPEYLSPEQASGRADQTGPPADIFGLGATLYTLLTGRPPYQGNLYQVMAQAQRAQFPAPRQLKAETPRALEAVCQRAMAAHPGDRYAGAQELAAEVERWLADEPVLAYREPLRVRAGRWVRRHKPQVAAATAALLVALAVGGGAWLWVKNERGAREAQVTGEVKDALNKATVCLDQARRASVGGAALFAQAREQAQRALALAESGPADDALKRQVRQLQGELNEEDKDRRLMAALEEAHLAQAENVAGESRFASERAVPRFREAFREYGLSAGEGAPAAAAQRIRQRPAAVREAIVAALDEWDGLAGDPKLRITEPHRQWLRALLEAAEAEDAWGRKLWAARAEKDPAKRRAALERLAASANVAQVPARALTRLGNHLNPAARVALLRRAQAQFPADFWVNQDLGVALQEVTPPEQDEAVRFLAAAAALRPESPGCLTNLGNALYGKGRLGEAIACYKKAIALDPKDAVAHLNLGNALTGKGRLGEAIACYKKAIALDPKDALAHLNLGGALAGKGRLDAAIACYKKAIALDPKLAAAHCNLGLALQDKGQKDAAIACYRKAIELDPKSAYARSRLGDALQDKGQVDAAIACYRTAIKFDPKFAWAHNSLGNALYGKGQKDEAIACYRKVIELDPKSAYAHCNLGLALQDKGQKDEAIACYRKAIELDPKSAYAHSCLGNALLDKGQVDPAIACYQKAIALDPKGAHNYNGLGLALDQAGRQKEAIQAWRRAVRLNPGLSDAHYWLAKALLLQGRRREAFESLEKASSANPKETMLSLQVAALQAWFGQEKEFAATRRKILALTRSTNEWYVAERAAKACSILPGTDKADVAAALALGRTGVRLQRNGWSLLALGMAEYRSGNDAATQEALLAAAKADPTNPQLTGIAAFYRAMSLCRQKKRAEARQLARAAAAKMKPLPKDERNALANNAYWDDLILWLAYKEAKAMLKFEAAAPLKEKNDKK
jgi:serine/threonine-protein kinase